MGKVGVDSIAEINKIKGDLKVAEEKFNEEQQRLKEEHENEIRALEEMVEEKQKYITNLELQLKTLKNEHTAVLESIKTVRDESKEMELKLLNSSEDKISEIKYKYEAEIRELKESKTQLEIELENSKSKLREELNKAS